MTAVAEEDEAFPIRRQTCDLEVELRGDEVLDMTRVRDLWARRHDSDLSIHDSIYMPLPVRKSNT